MTDGTDDLDVLTSTAGQGYLHWPLPCATDQQIRELVDALVGKDPIELTREQSGVLKTFAERMASLSRFKSDAGHLRAGLLAAVFATGSEDGREVLLVLPLLWRSAEVLGLDPAEEFRKAADRTGRGQFLLDFTGRSPEDRSIEAMGFKEIEDEFGFFYERTW